MIENRYKNKIIDNFKSEKVRSVVPSSITNNNFFYRIPLKLDREKLFSYELSQNSIKIQIVCEDETNFKNNFKNKFFSNTSNYKSYNESEENSLLGKFLHKNIFYEYNKKTSAAKDLIFNTPFNINNFLDIESNKINSNIYNIDLTSSFSKKLFNKNIKNIRVFILDAKNNIIDETGFVDCDFRSIKNTRKLVDDKIFYQNYFLNSFSETLKISADSSFKNIAITSSSNIDTEMFDSFNVFLSYDNGSKSIVCSSENISFEKSKFLITENVSSFCYRIAEDFYSGIEAFNFKISIDLNIKSNLNNKEIDKKQKVITLFKEITVNKNNILPRNCATFFKERYFSDILRKLNLTQKTEIIDGTKAFHSIKISENNNITEEILKNITISQIKLNNSTIENKAYKFKDLIIENLIYFKGKSILDIFENNLFEFYCKTNNREIVFEFEIEFLEKKFKFISNKIVNNSDYQTAVKKVNRITKNNIVVSKINVNTSLNQANKSVFDFKNISITNLSSYNDLAYSLGYILNNQGDIKNFLANSIVKVENTTNLSTINILSHNTNYFFLNELFNMEEFNSGTISMKNNYINNYIKTDDYFSVINTKRNVINKNIIDFLISTDSVDTFRKLINEQSLNIENTLKIKILPLPEIISRYRGYDLDELDNPINTNLHNDIENLSNIKSRLNRELVVYLYTGNKNLNWDKFNKYKRILMNSTKSDSVNNYSEFFDDIVFLNMSENDYFENKINYDKNEIIAIKNIDEIYLNSSLQVSGIEENFNKKYYDFSLSNKEFFIENLPFSLVFENSKYLSSNNEYIPKEINLIKNEAQSKIKINITNLKNIYTINQIKNSRFYVRMSLHFLMNRDGLSLENLNDTNTNFLKTFYGGKECLTYNSKYVLKNPSKLSDIRNIIEASKIQCITEGENIYLTISDETNDLNISNLNYNIFAEFFDFCKSNNVSHILDTVLRFSVSFSVADSEDFIFGVFNHKIPYINLIDKKLSINSLSKISSLIVT